MAVEITGYCYDSNGQVCITIEHSSNSATSSKLAKVKITLTVNGVTTTHEIESNDKTTICQAQTKGTIEASDDEGDAQPVKIDPQGPGNTCP